MITIIYFLFFGFGLLCVFLWEREGRDTYKISLIVLLIFLFFLLFCIFIDINGIQRQTGTGQHSGYVTAIETNGLIWKTSSVYFKTDPKSSQEDIYCIKDRELMEKLKELSLNKKLVTIKYKTVLSAGLKYCSFESNIFVDIIVDIVK